MEHLTLVVSGGEAAADGIVLGVANDSPFRLHYKVICDSSWRVRRAKINLMDGRRSLSLTSSGEGQWFNEEGAEISALDGCIDIDITATPFTNTLPIHRLALEQGESADIKVAYVWIPDLEVESDEQRYTCLEIGADGGKYHFEQIATGFKALIQVDADGLVEDYEDLFGRVV